MSVAYQPPPTHWCDLPEIWSHPEYPTFDLDEHDQPRRHGVEFTEPPRLLYRCGTVWVCEHCGQGWVLAMTPEHLGRYVHVLPHPEWRPETRHERRRRLRVPWYRRTPKPHVTTPQNRR